MLAAEDDRTITLLLERMLARAGAEAFFTVNGHEAVDLFECLRPEIVLTDGHISILGGQDATRRIREIEAVHGWGRVPVIALTAILSLEEGGLCFAAGMGEVVAKPFRKKDVVEALRRYVAASGCLTTSVDAPSDVARYSG